MNSLQGCEKMSSERGGATVDGHEQSQHADEISELRAEIDRLKKGVSEPSHRIRALEARIIELKGELAGSISRNERLSGTLREAKEQIESLRDDVERLTATPNTYGVVLHRNDDDTFDVISTGRKFRVVAGPEVDSADVTSDPATTSAESTSGPATTRNFLPVEMTSKVSSSLRVRTRTPCVP